MAYFPLYVDIEGKKCVVVGGGRIAAGKVRQLLEFKAAVTVLAPRLTAELKALAAAGKIVTENRTLAAELCEGEMTAVFADASLVVAATDDATVNAAVSHFCRARGILVNVVDVKELCTFFFPAIIKREDIVVAVSTGGSSPAFAARIRRELEEMVPEKYGRTSLVMGKYREYVKEAVPDVKARKQVFEALLACALEREQVLREDVEQIIRTYGACGTPGVREDRMEEYLIPEKIRIGTRGSRLALAQTELFIARLQKSYPGIVCETVIKRTAGDKILDQPLLAFGGKAVFVSEFEDAILDGSIDCAVHSAKDMPMELAEGLCVACVLPREDAADVLLMRKGTQIAALDAPVIGTGSLRRQSQLALLYPKAVCKSLRGNVPTRIEKLRAGDYDGIILAAAGLKRLGLEAETDLDYVYFDTRDMVPAGGQAIIAVEGRAGEPQRFLRGITDARTQTELETERYVLRLLAAGCHEAVGVYAKVTEASGTAGTFLSLSIMRELEGLIMREEGQAAVEERFALAERLVAQLRGNAAWEK